MDKQIQTLPLQGLLRSRRLEVETEKHMSQLSQREIGRLQQEIKTLETRVEEIKERKNIHENSIFNNTQQLEKLKAQMNWDQQVRNADKSVSVEKWRI